MKPDQTEMNPGTQGRLWIIVGAVLAATAVGFGAIGAHMLEKWVAENFDDPQRRLELWETASRYLMYHSLGLLAVGVVNFGSKRKRNIVGMMMLVGVMLFSGCLYAYVLTNQKPLVHVVPLGGVGMIISWLLFALFAFTNGARETKNDGASS